MKFPRIPRGPYWTRVYFGVTILLNTVVTVMLFRKFLTDSTTTSAMSDADHTSMNGGNMHTSMETLSSFKLGSSSSVGWNKTTTRALSVRENIPGGPGHGNPESKLACGDKDLDIPSIGASTSTSSRRDTETGSISPTASPTPVPTSLPTDSPSATTASPSAAPTINRKAIPDQVTPKTNPSSSSARPTESPSLATDHAPKGNATSRPSGAQNPNRAEPSSVAAFPSGSLTQSNITTTTATSDSHHIIDAIIQKWNISTPSQKEKQLLQQIWDRQEETRYQPHQDLIVFTHPMKTGGTTLSKIMAHTIPKESIVPGSDPSGYFHFDQFYRHYDNLTTNAAKADFWANQRVLYSHSLYRAFDGSGKKRQRLHSFLHDGINATRDHHKRLRHVIMMRDPLNFVASNFFEWFCAQTQWEREARRLGIPNTASNISQCAYSLEDRTKARILSVQLECQNLTKQERYALRKRAKERCNAFYSGQADPTPWCRSIPAFLESEKFPRFFHNVYKDYTYKSKDDKKDEESFESHVYGALEYLGGLDMPDFAEGAMMWFGITERMTESLCLFHYQTRLPIMAQEASYRFKKCRPTSFWSADDIQRYRSMQVMDHAVYHAANAILDLKLAQMRRDLWSRVLTTTHMDDASHDYNHNNTANVTQFVLDNMNFTSLECMGPRPLSPSVAE